MIPEEVKLPNERWLPIPNTLNRYFISDHGRCYTKFLNKIKSQKLHKGYMEVDLSTSELGKRITRRRCVHRLVALNFIPNPLNKPHINHIDSNKQNNHLANLEWCTPLENVEHALINGRYGKYFDKQTVQLIRQLAYQGVPNKDISSGMNVPLSTVYQIVNLTIRTKI